MSLNDEQLEKIRKMFAHNIEDKLDTYTSDIAKEFHEKFDMKMDDLQKDFTKQIKTDIDEMLYNIFEIMFKLIVIITCLHIVLHLHSNHYCYK